MSTRALGALFVAAAACSTPGVDPFDGGAWPDRRPRAAWPSDGGLAAIITNNRTDTVYLVDLRTMRVVSSAPVGTRTLGLNGPHHIVFADELSALFTPMSFPAPVIAPGPHAAHAAGTSPGILLKLDADTFRELGRADIDENPGDIAISPDHRWVLVSHYDLTRAQSVLPDGGDPTARNGAVYVFDARTLERKAVVRPCILPHSTVVSPDSVHVYVACAGDDQVAVFDLVPPYSVHTRVRVGPGAGVVPANLYSPYAMTLDASGERLYVGTLGSGGREVARQQIAGYRVREFRDGQEAPSFGVLGRGLGQVYFPALSRDERWLYVPAQSPDTISRLDASTLDVLDARSFAPTECRWPHQAGVTPDGRVFVVCEGDWRADPPTVGALLELDPVTLATRTRVPLGLYPDVLVFGARSGR